VAVRLGMLAMRLVAGGSATASPVSKHTAKAIRFMTLSFIGFVQKPSQEINS
jgi:hypothetical protein